MIDLLLIEAGDGGELVQQASGDLVTITGLENSIYLSLFGGNAWWANDLIPDKTARYECQTEQALNDNALTSAGRLKIEAAIKADLAWIPMITGTTFTVSTRIAAPDRLEIDIFIAGKTFSYYWNPLTGIITFEASGDFSSDFSDDFS
jgi:hypothetical protein